MKQKLCMSRIWFLKSLIAMSNAFMCNDRSTVAWITVCLEVTLLFVVCSLCLWFIMSVYHYEQDKAEKSRKLKNTISDESTKTATTKKALLFAMFISLFIFLITLVNLVALQFLVNHCNFNDNKSNIFSIYYILMQIVSALYFVGYQIVYCLFAKKLIMIFDTTLFALSKKLQYIIWSFPVLFWLFYISSKFLGILLNSYSIMQGIHGLASMIYLFSTFFLLSLFVKKLSQLALLMRNMIDSNPGSRDPSANEEKIILTHKQKGLITIMTRTTILVVFYLISSLIAGGVMGIIAAMGDVENGESLAIAFVVTGIDATINSICVMCQHEAAKKLYYLLFSKLDEKIQQCCANRVKINMKIVNVKNNVTHA